MLLTRMYCIRRTSSRPDQRGRDEVLRIQRPRELKLPAREGNRVGRTSLHVVRPRELKLPARERNRVGRTSLIVVRPRELKLPARGERRIVL